MLREKWREQLSQGSDGDIASRSLEQLFDEDLAQLGLQQFAHAVNALSVSNAWKARARDGCE